MSIARDRTMRNWMNSRMAVSESLTSIAVAYDGLSPEAQRLFRRLALLEAPDFAAWVSVPLLATNRERAEDLLESLVDVQLLEVD